MATIRAIVLASERTMNALSKSALPFIPLGEDFREPLFGMMVEAYREDISVVHLHKTVSRVYDQLDPMHIPDTADLLDILEDPEHYDSDPSVETTHPLAHALTLRAAYPADPVRDYSVKLHDETIKRMLDPVMRRCLAAAIIDHSFDITLEASYGIAPSDLGLFGSDYFFNESVRRAQLKRALKQNIGARATDAFKPTTLHVI